MRIAFVSPLPPAKSGIADYSAALLDPLSRLAEVETFTRRPSRIDADVAVYQLGNNPYHSFAYDAAMEHAGVVVLHEASLHHLIADRTIHRGDWDAYWREVEYNGATRAGAPDYDLPLLRSILDRSRAVIVHSETVEQAVRAHGFPRPIARIPHGASVGDLAAIADRAVYRTRLGIEEGTPVFGIFGFLKPYKRVNQALRAFRRLLRAHPETHMILVGELHPDLNLELSPHIRHIDFAPLAEFNGYMAACDIVVNLRYPTVGETSGTLLRAFGLGKAAPVSDVGSFREFPDEICIKVPVDHLEEEYLFEYMLLLAKRPEIAQRLGGRARDWVARTCSWESVAERYVSFLGAADWMPPKGKGDAYAQTHRTRLEKTLAITPSGGAGDRVLEMGSYLQITPALKTRLGYGEVRGCYYGALGKRERHVIAPEPGAIFECEIEYFDASLDPFPYPDAHFSTVLCCELIEHLAADPMHMMIEIHRILKPGGHLVITTPNISSLRSVAAILQGFHPMLFPAYLRDPNDSRHAREYTPREIERLLEDSGFEVGLLETGPFRDQPQPQLGWVEHLLDQYRLTRQHRGDGIYAVARKAGPVRERYPKWLYA